MKKPVRGGLLPEGIIALAFTVGFARSGSLLKARKLLAQGQEANLAQDVMQIAMVQAQTQTTGRQVVGGNTFDWKAVRPENPAFTQAVDARHRPHQLSNAGSLRKAGASS